MPKKTISVDFVLDINGLIPDVGDEGKVRIAMHRIARLLEGHVKDRAAVEVGKALHPEGPPRNRGDYPGPMADYYTAEVQPDGSILFDNPTNRAEFFEFGTEPHEIWASGLFERGRGRPARGSRGQFTKGAEALFFEYVGYDDEGNERPGFFLGEMVDHPGQDANPIMAESVDALLDDMGEIVLDEITAGYGGLGRRMA